MQQIDFSVFWNFTVRLVPGIHECTNTHEGRKGGREGLDWMSSELFFLPLSFCSDLLHTRRHFSLTV